MNEINKYLQSSMKFIRAGGLSLQEVRPRIICNDGESVSIQAGEYVYSTPRKNGQNHYSCIEAGFPSVEPPLSWQEYTEDWENPTKTIYAWMPIEIAQEFIDAHGGKDWKKSSKQ